MNAIGKDSYCKILCTSSHIQVLQATDLRLLSLVLVGRNSKTTEVKAECKDLASKISFESQKKPSYQCRARMRIFTESKKLTVVGYLKSSRRRNSSTKSAQTVEIILEVRTPRESFKLQNKPRKRRNPELSETFFDKTSGKTYAAKLISNSTKT